jgi:nucleoside-diphosphate-sugar epimerase
MSFGHLDNLLADGRPFGRLLVKDVRDPQLQKHLEEADCVFHFAGIAALPVCQSAPMLAIDVHVGGTAQVLEAARRANVRRVIFSSTSAVYENTQSKPYTEDDVAIPDLVYASSKRMSESLCESYAKNYGMDIIVCRFFNVYGPHQDIERLTPPFTSYVARELAHNRAPILFNNTDVRRDYVHADDVIELLLLMLRSRRHFEADKFNVCTGQGYSVPQLYEIFREVSGKSIDAEFRDPKQFWDNYNVLFAGNFPLQRDRVVKEVYKEAIGANSKAVETFGWTPRIDIHKGLLSVYLDAKRRLERGCI